MSPKVTVHEGAPSSTGGSEGCGGGANSFAGGRAGSSTGSGPSVLDSHRS